MRLKTRLRVILCMAISKGCDQPLNGSSRGGRSLDTDSTRVRSSQRYETLGKGSDRALSLPSRRWLEPARAYDVYARACKNVIDRKGNIARGASDYDGIWPWPYDAIKMHSIDDGRLPQSQRGKRLAVTCQITQAESKE